MAIAPLTITGYDDVPVPNRFLRHDGPTEHLAILLPGMGYSNDMPLLHYASHLAREHGADILGVDYAYQQVAGEVELRQRMAADVGAAVTAAMRQRPEYRKVTVMGKSIGTLAIAVLLEHQILPFETRCVWLTPLIKREEVRDRLLLHPGPSFVAIGTEDPHYDPVWLAQWQGATGGTLTIVEGGDHSLAIAHDVPRSIAALGDIMARLQSFLTAA